jgi:hypothetical protein
MADRLRALPATLLKRQATDDEIANAVALATLMKFPTDEQIVTMRQHLQKTRNRERACEDIIWAFMNTREFMNLHGFTMTDIQELSDLIYKKK